MASKLGVVAAAVAAGLFLVLTGVWFGLRTGRGPPPTPLVIACLDTPHSGLLLVAAAKGYFADEGLAVTLRTTPTGYQAIQMVLKADAEIGAAAETPIALALDQGQALRIIATVFTSRKNVGVAARRDRGIEKPADLQGKRIGVVFGTASHYMLETFLAFNGVAPDQVTQVPITADRLVTSVVSGEVDAVAAWNPSFDRARRMLGDNAAVFSSGEVYAETFNLVVRSGYAEQHPQTVAAVLRALVRAEHFIRDQDGEAVALIAAATRTDPASLRAALDPRTYEVTLSQSLLLATESEARWYLRRGLVKDGRMPDILAAFEIGPLQSVKPSGVSIVK